MTLFDHLPPDMLGQAGAVNPIPTGTRVAKLGTVSFVRSGFARVRWDDGTTSSEWVADLTLAALEPEP